MTLFRPSLVPPTALRAINNVLPVPLPFLAPDKGALAHGADLGGKVRFLTHRTKMGLIARRSIPFLGATIRHCH